MPRLFIGIPLPNNLKEELLAYQKEQKLTAGTKWTVEENLHITLYFFSEVPQELYANLHALLSLICEEASGFMLPFDRFMLAPSSSSPRMIWARYKKATSFLDLHSRIHQLFQQIHPDVQRRKSPIPHITLARLKDWNLAHELRPSSLLKGTNIEVTQLILWESVSVPGGVKYEVREAYSLE